MAFSLCVGFCCLRWCAAASVLRCSPLNRALNDKLNSQIKVVCSPLFEAGF